MRSSYQLPLPSPSFCPEEPTLPYISDHPRHNPERTPSDEDSNQDKISRAIRVISRKTLNSLLKPKILVTKKVGVESYQSMEHKRQLKSLKKRIGEIKNWQQRKKDHSDPIAYPIYLIRDEDNIKDSRIDVYCKRVLGKSNEKKKKSQKLPQKPKQKREDTPSQQKQIRRYPAQQLSPKPFYSSANSPKTIKNRSELIQPSYWKTKPSPYQQKKKVSRKIINQPQPINLPECQVGVLLAHIYEQRVFKDEQLKILKSRMEHFYGMKKVKNVWSKTMKLLGRKK